MRLFFVKPERELRPYVESFWVFESPIGLPQGNIAAPNGCCKLTFAYGNSFVSIGNGKAMSRPPQRLNFVGSTDSRILLQSSPRKIGCVGIEFRPHGAFPFLGIPVGETLNFRGDADVVLGKWARRVQEGLESLQSIDQRVTFLRDQLIHLLRKNQRSALWRMQERNNDLVAYCVQALKSTHGRIRVRELESRTGFSRRYLDLLFKQHVGLSPKVLAAIFRFQLFYRKWAQEQSFDLLKDDLYEYYYDQAHFTKEFKKMTGHTPREYCHEVSNEFGRALSLR